MPQGYKEASNLLLQILEADLDDVKFPRDSTLIQYVDNLVYTLGNNYIPKRTQQNVKGQALILFSSGKILWLSDMYGWAIN